MSAAGGKKIKKMKKITVSQMAAIAVMAAVICVLGPLSVPIGAVPISLTPLAVYISVFLLGRKKGTMAVFLYILIGLIGIPVFSGFTGGPGKLFGPTGGYLISFVPMAYLAGIFIDRYWNRWLLQLLGMLLGLVLCYAFGTVWLATVAGYTFTQALAIGVIPFIGFDLAKIAVSLLLGRTLRERLAKTKIYASVR